MGTSSDHTGGTGGDWKPAKIAATSFVKHGGRDNAQRALGRLVTALGGAAGAGSGSGAARVGAGTLADFFGTAADAGLDAALTEAGLTELAGQPASVVIAALVDLVAGPGEDLAEVAARDAACDVLEQLAEDVETYEQLEEALPAPDETRALLARFVAAYIYRLLLPVLAERYGRLEDPREQARRDREARETVEAVVALELSERQIDPLLWKPAAADGEIKDLFDAVFEYLEERG